MKKYFPILIAIATLAIILAVYYSVGCTRGSGNVISEKFEVEEFSKIELSLGSAILYLRQGETNSLHIEAEDNILERLEVDVVEGILKISRSLGCFWYSEPVKVYASLPQLNAIIINGSAEVIGESKFVSDEIGLNINGSGKIDLDLEVEELTTSIAGSGKIKLEGIAESHDFGISGSGQLEAYNLVTNKTKIKISGSGKAEISVIKELEVKISGSGKVTYRGNPEEIIQDISGSGSIEKVEGDVVIAEIGVNKKDIKEALAAKHPDWDVEEFEVSIGDIVDEFATGSILGENGADGDLWFAAFTDEGWVITWDGNGTITCQDIESYDFPVSFIPECFDEETEELVTRGEEIRDISDEDLQEQLDIEIEAEPAEE